MYTGAFDRFWRIDLTDLSWGAVAGEIVNMTLVSGGDFGFSCDSSSDCAGVTNFGFTPSSAFVEFDSMKGDLAPVFEFDVSHVPEPSIIALLGIGLAGMGFARRRVNLRRAQRITASGE